MFCCRHLFPAYCLQSFFKAWRKALNHSIAVTPDKLSINDFKSYSILWSEITALSIDEINYSRAGRQIFLKIHVLDETAYLKNSCFRRLEILSIGDGIPIGINPYEEKPSVILETLQQALEKYKK